MAKIVEGQIRNRLGLYGSSECLRQTVRCNRKAGMSDGDSALRGDQRSFAGQLVGLLESGPKTAKKLRELINKGKDESNKVVSATR